jgi:Na+/H+ antiporter NhaD/arsenite permease-like protein
MRLAIIGAVLLVVGAAAVGTGTLPLWLFLAMFATLSTLFLSLDTTAVLLTPVVVSVTRQGLSPLPFALMTVWLANTASVLLPISNLTNLRNLRQRRLAFAGHINNILAERRPIRRRHVFPRLDEFLPGGDHPVDRNPGGGVAADGP